MKLEEAILDILKLIQVDIHKLRAEVGLLLVRNVPRKDAVGKDFIEDVMCTGKPDCPCAND